MISIAKLTFFLRQQRANTKFISISSSICNKNIILML